MRIYQIQKLNRTTSLREHLEHPVVGHVLRLTNVFIIINFAAPNTKFVTTIQSHYPTVDIHKYNNHVYTEEEFTLFLSYH